MLRGVLETEGIKGLQKVVDRIDELFQERLNSSKTRKNLWTGLRTFLISNDIMEAKMLGCNIKNQRRFYDAPYTTQEVQRAFDKCLDNWDRCALALLFEGGQRVGTVSSLTIGDVRKKIENGENEFLIWVDAKRTKCRVDHWFGLGKLSTYYIRKHLEDLGSKGIPVDSDDMPLLGLKRFPYRHMGTDYLQHKVSNVLKRAGIQGKNIREGCGHRHEKVVHSFKKLFVTYMQKKGVDWDVIRYLIGQRASTYSEWCNDPEGLLGIYKANYPRLDSGDALEDIVKFAKARGFELDATALRRCGKVGVREEDRFVCSGSVEEREVRKLAFSDSQKRI